MKSLHECLKAILVTTRLHQANKPRSIFANDMIGLCDIIKMHYFKVQHNLKDEERELVLEYLHKNKPVNHIKHFPFFWKSNNLYWRIKWLEKHIKLTKVTN